MIENLCCRWKLLCMNLKSVDLSRISPHSPLLIFWLWMGQWPTQWTMYHCQCKSLSLSLLNELPIQHLRSFLSHWQPTTWVKCAIGLTQCILFSIKSLRFSFSHLFKGSILRLCLVGAIPEASVKSTSCWFGTTMALKTKFFKKLTVQYWVPSMWFEQTPNNHWPKTTLSYSIPWCIPFARFSIILSQIIALGCERHQDLQCFFFLLRIPLVNCIP